jgi:hypothetical protein
MPRLFTRPGRERTGLARSRPRIKMAVNREYRK